MKLLRHVWFWLMIISIILFLFFLVFLHCIMDWKIFSSECFWVAVGSLGSLISVIVATLSIIKSENIRKKKDTYDAFNCFKIRNFDIEAEIEKFPIEHFANNYQKSYIYHKEEIEKINKYLCEIEQIATCANTNIFDVMVIYNMGGPFLINKFDFLYPIIKQKRMDKKRDTIYIEFENMVKTLKKIQYKKWEEK